MDHCATVFNTLLGPLLSDRSGVSSGAGLTKESAAAHNKRRMTKGTKCCHLKYIALTTNILPSFLDRCKSVLSAPGSL